MRILVVNDDGIQAEGIRHLAELAKTLGEVTVVAPKSQCSGMSHSISFEKEMLVRKVEYPVEGVDAYSVTGTPADCVRVGIKLMGEKPDIVFSGINKGYNIGFEALYSGTVGAAMEALVFDVPAIAFSQDNFEDFSAMEAYFGEIVPKLLEMEIGERQIWNINVPNATAEEIEGVEYDCVPAREMFYHGGFELEQLGERMYQMRAFYGRKEEAPEGTDMHALIHKRIAVGTLTSRV